MITIINLVINYKDLIKLIKLVDNPKMDFLMIDCMVYNIPKKIKDILGRFNKRKEGYKTFCDLPLRGYFISQKCIFNQLK